MTFKVNYGFQKAERDRAKLAKKEAKRREKEASPEQARDEAPASSPTSGGAQTDDASVAEGSPS